MDLCIYIVIFGCAMEIVCTVCTVHTYVLHVRMYYMCTYVLCVCTVYSETSLI